MKSAMTIGAVSAIALAGVLAASPAYAGDNGQQINFCPGHQAAYGRAYASGTNQNGKAVSSPVVHLPGPGHCKGLTRWWWVGNVTITWSNHRNEPIGQSTCYVPPKNNYADWENCYGN